MSKPPPSPVASDATSRQRVMITPEGLALPLILASRGARLGALLLDFGFLIAALIAAVIALAYMTGGVVQLGQQIDGKDAASAAWQFFLIGLAAVWFLARNGWFLFFELGARGATPGKRIAGIRIAARNGGRLTAEMVIARNLLRDVELFVPLALLGALSASGVDGGTARWVALAWLVMFAGMPLFNRDRLRAGDLVAGTWVVEAPRRRLAPVLAPVLTGAAAVEHPDETYRFGEAELGAYGEFELQTLERVLREGQATAQEAVAETICGKIGWRPPRGESVRPFLDAYYTQLRARLETRMRLGDRKPDKFSGP